jgi:prefoldin subunit 5
LHSNPNSLVDTNCCRKNVSTINVLVGVDCHVEMTLNEALEFIEKKEKQLHR